MKILIRNISKFYEKSYLPGSTKIILLFFYSYRKGPVNSTPDVSYFLFLSGLPVRDTMCNMGVFSFENFGAHFHTTKTATQIPINCFWRINGEKVQKVEFWSQCPGLNCVKMDPKIFIKKNNHVAHSILDQEKIKSTIRPGVLIIGSS